MQQLGGVAQLLDHEHRGVLLDRLVDGGHDAHVHQHLDDFGRLDRHLLRQLGHGDGLADRHLALDRRGRHLEAMLGLVAADRHGARLRALLLLVARADIAGDVQLLAPVAGAPCRRPPRRRRRGALCACACAAPPRLARACARARLSLARLRCSAARRASSSRLLLRVCSSSMRRRFSASSRSRSRRSASRRSCSRSARLRLLLGLALLRVELLLLCARLLLEHVALDVGALAAHLDVDGARAALVAGELQLALRLALERDLARRAHRRRVVAAVAAAQVRQQLELRFLADHVLGLDDLDAGLIELREQPVDRHLQHLGKLGNRYFSHTVFLVRSASVPAPRTSARAPS